MRIRSGKGQVIAFDKALEKKLEVLKEAKGYYPTLKQIGESYDPPHSVNFIDRALRRLSAAGRLSEEASLVYNSKGKENEKSVKTKRIKKKNG